MPTVLIKDLIETVIEDYAPLVGKNPQNIEITVIGSRVGEKINEELISPIELAACYETKDMFIIFTNVFFEHNEPIKNFKINGTKVKIDNNFSYSTKNAILLEKHEIKSLLKELNLL